MDHGLLDAMKASGLCVRDIIDDGMIHRCGTLKKPNGDNGWYVVYADGKGASFGNWEAGGDWVHWQGEKITEIERAKINERREQMKAERLATQKAAADKAAHLYRHADKKGYSPYLERKGIKAHGARFDGTSLVIPLQDAEGTIHSLQYINSDGSKAFLKGGRVSGCFYPIFEREVDVNERVIVCEGFATGATIAMTTQLPVVVALNANNLKQVCDSLPYTNIVIAADNDKSGVGENAAKATGYPYIMPEIEGWDFSDVFLNGHNVEEYFIQQKTDNKTIRAHGLVQEIADWITATSIRPQPELSIAAALCFVGMIKGHTIKGRTGLRTNLMALSLAPTGSGKDHPQTCISFLCEACGIDDRMMGYPASGSALLTGLAKSRCISLLCIDEIGRFIGNATMSSAGGYQKEIVDYLIQLYSCANRTFRGKQYANEKQNPQVTLKNPHLCVLGSTVKEKLQEACRSADVLDGFLNRWIVFKSDDRPKRNKANTSLEPPADIVAKIMQILPHVDIYNNIPDAKEISFSPEAWDMFDAYRESMDEAARKDGHPHDKLYVRSAENVEKIALTLCDGDIILRQDVKMAIDIVTYSNANILAFADNIADNVYESDYNRVRDIIRESGFIDKSRLTRKTQFITGGSRRRNEIIESLIDSNLIAAFERNKRVCYKPLNS